MTDAKVNLRGMIRLDDVSAECCVLHTNSLGHSGRFTSGMHAVLHDLPTDILIDLCCMQVEDLLTEVLHRLDAQDGAISRLNALIDTMMPMKVAKE